MKTRDPHILKIGHRGACGYKPENTLCSFWKALKLGVDMVEFDIHACKTGELVVIHDDKVDRTTNGHGYVSKKTFNELKMFDAGRGERIPTLGEVLDLIDRKVKVNIELKGAGTAKPVTDLIIKYIENNKWAYDDFLVSSFNHYELKKFNCLLPKVKIGALISDIPIGIAEFAEKVNAYSVHLSMKFINQVFVDDAHNRGMKVFVWVVNNIDDMQRVKALGVDGVFSDYPDKI